MIKIKVRTFIQISQKILRINRHLEKILLYCLQDLKESGGV